MLRFVANKHLPFPEPFADFQYFPIMASTRHFLQDNVKEDRRLFGSFPFFKFDSEHCACASHILGMSYLLVSTCWFIPGVSGVNHPSYTTTNPRKILES